MSPNPTGIGGFKEVIAMIEGRGVYSRLMYESGVHRVQRVPATEARGRIHTSTITVMVLPEAEEVDVQINEKDIRKDTFCSSDPAIPDDGDRPGYGRGNPLAVRRQLAKASESGSPGHSVDGHGEGESHGR